MSFFVSALRIIAAIVSGIGGILVFFASFDNDFSLMSLGVLLLFLTAAFDVYTVQYENQKKLERLSNDLLQTIGSSFAFPVLLFVYYFVSSDKTILNLSLALSLVAFFRVASITIKVYLFENNLL